MKTGDSLYISLLPYCAISLRDTFLSAVLLTDFCYVQNSMADEDRHPSLAAVPCWGLGIPFRVWADLHVLWALHSRKPARSVHSHQLLPWRQEGYQMIVMMVLSSEITCFGAEHERSVGEM